MIKTNTPFYKSPIIMVGISLFVILVFATFYRIYIALETYPGLVIEDAYKKGENYAVTLANKKKLKELGWEIVLDFPEKLTSNLQQKYRMRLIQNKSIHLKNISNKVTLFFYRPSSVIQDFQVTMVKKGKEYFANVSVPLKGRWDVIAEISINGTVLHTGKEVFYH
jgi:nitrogen fixation protein FixH